MLPQNYVTCKNCLDCRPENKKCDNCKENCDCKENVYKVVSGCIQKNGIDIVYLKRFQYDENTPFNIMPCEKDAMTHFLVDALNNGDFDTYFDKYMKT